VSAQVRGPEQHADPLRVLPHVAGDQPHHRPEALGTSPRKLGMRRGREGGALDILLAPVASLGRHPGFSFDCGAQNQTKPAFLFRACCL
jgi:hypothetical protein